MGKKGSKLFTFREHGQKLCDIGGSVWICVLRLSHFVFACRTTPAMSNGSRRSAELVQRCTPRTNSTNLPSAPL